ncbi:MAG TPA: amine dehydrogenase large subunit [Steroidobacteraceae bacterium]|jgi:methylamine dehydrogenase heavy chain|nr:amine dehydrogenase large subunit [Steroidobacteraceae bacterium]
MRRLHHALLLSALLGTAAHAELPPDSGNGPRSATLAVPPSKHWVWVNDFVFSHMADGMAYLVDGDSGRYLGTLSTGYGFARLVLPRDGKVIYSPETYFSRGTRGTRTDVVTLYDPATLKPAGEIPIPPKRSSNMPMMANAVLTDDDRFLLIYNFNPAQSVTVVDTRTRKFVREVETPGCALVFPTGPRSFFSVCGDGSLLLVALDDAGAAQQKRTDPVFDLAADPVTEKAVRAGDTWYFVSFAGRIYPLRAGAHEAKVGASWWLTTDVERKAGWRPGGLQQLALDPGKSRLYAIMHRGGVETHKDPGKDVWVYDAASGRRTQQLALRSLASSIQLSSDAALMFSIFIDGTDLDVYDASSGRLLRTVEHVGTTPTIMVTP